MAPTTAPTQVFAMLITLRGVYTPAYSPMLAAPSAAVVLFACRGQKLAHRLHYHHALEQAMPCPYI